MEIGSWHVGDCILAKFAMTFTIFETSAKDKRNATQITLPDTAIAKQDKNGTQCSKDLQKEQILELTWTGKQKNDTSINLTRFIRIYYKRMPNAS